MQAKHWHWCLSALLGKNGSHFFSEHLSIPLLGKCLAFLFYYNIFFKFTHANLHADHVPRSRHGAGGSDGGGVPATGHAARDRPAVQIPVPQAGAAAAPQQLCVHQPRGQEAPPLPEKKPSPHAGHSIAAHFIFMSHFLCMSNDHGGLIMV